MICELRTSYPIYGQRLDNHSNMESVPGRWEGLRADLESHPTVTHWQLADARRKSRRRPTLVRAFLRQAVVGRMVCARVFLPAATSITQLLVAKLLEIPNSFVALLKV